MARRIHDLQLRRPTRVHAIGPDWYQQTWCPLRPVAGGRRLAIDEAEIRRLDEWREHQRIMVDCDLFASLSSTSEIDLLLAAMAARPQHNFLVPTDWPLVMSGHLLSYTGSILADSIVELAGRGLCDIKQRQIAERLVGQDWPVRNLHPGVIVRGPEHFARLAVLGELPAPVRFVLVDGPAIPARLEVESLDRANFILWRPGHDSQDKAHLCAAER